MQDGTDKEGGFWPKLVEESRVTDVMDPEYGEFKADSPEGRMIADAVAANANDGMEPDEVFPESVANTATRLAKAAGVSDAQLDAIYVQNKADAGMFDALAPKPDRKVTDQDGEKGSAE